MSLLKGEELYYSEFSAVNLFSSLVIQPIKFINMKQALIFLCIFIAACNNADRQTQTGNKKSDTVNIGPDTIASVKPAEPIAQPPAKKIYGNARFKEVTVEKTGDHQFLIKGKAQVFEANISWVVEDGHNELKKGFVMTDAGAPEWGNFTFPIDVQKKRENSTLTLILFESSAKDGSRQHELPIALK